MYGDVIMFGDNFCFCLTKSVIHSKKAYPNLILKILFVFCDKINTLLQTYYKLIVKKSFQSDVNEYPPPHPQSSVHDLSDFLHWHRFAHFFMHPHLISSLHALDASSTGIHRGVNPSPSFFHPHIVLSNSGIFFLFALHQMLELKKFLFNICTLIYFLIPLLAEILINSTCSTSVSTVTIDTFLYSFLEPSSTCRMSQHPSDF